MTDKDILSDYLQSLYGIEPLSIEKESYLAARIAKGDEGALHTLITHNLRFVVHVVRSMTYWKHSKMPVEDIIGIGNEQLFIAAKRWKPKNNAKFATYAKSFIVRGVRRELDNLSNIIRLPMHIVEAIKKMNYNQRNLSQILGREPTSKELSKIMGITESKLAQLQACVLREPVSIENLNTERYTNDEED
jgi:DNA-directed RNA polymerase sigma subunit (sigma70/sigma32)